VKLRVRDTAAPEEIPVLAVAGGLDMTAGLVAAGARMVDLGGADPDVITGVRARHPGVIVCADGEAADIVRDLGVALRTGAGLICRDRAHARAALDGGISRGAILVEASPAQVAEVAGDGWAALADVDGPDGTAAPSAAVAVAAVCAWLGAAVVRTRHVAPVRRSLDMTTSIRGTRPPSWTVRGLA
jgi:hypothetical protein